MKMSNVFWGENQFKNNNQFSYFWNVENSKVLMNNSWEEVTNIHEAELGEMVSIIM